MTIRTIIALLFAASMLGAGLAQQTEPTQPQPPTQEQPTQPEQPAQPEQPEQPEEPLAPGVGDEMDTEGEEILGPVGEVRAMPVEGIMSTLLRNDALADFHYALREQMVHMLLTPNEEFTVFAPSTLPADATLLTRETLAFHVVRGSYSFNDLWRMAEGAGGTTTLTTVLGDTMTIEISGDTLMIAGTATITQANLPADNGFVHVISAAVTPPAPAPEG